MKAEVGHTRAREIMTVYEVAEYLKVHYMTVYRMLKHGDIPAFHLGIDWRFRRQDVQRWIVDRQTVPAEPKPTAKRGPKRK
jgi:excisionase family DNA binding protein